MSICKGEPMTYSLRASALDLAGVREIRSESTSDHRLVSHTEHVVAEKYRLMAHKLHRERQEKSLQVVLVTSSIPAEGKTSVAANVATVLARTSSRVLLIDADMRAPDLPKALGLPRDMPGLADVLAGECSLRQALCRVVPASLYFLPGGGPSLDPVMQLQTQACADLLACVRQSFDWIVIDSPPLIPFADSHCLAALADGVVLVVRWGFTPRNELDQAYEALARVPVVGLVLNSFDEPSHEEYYSYYKRNRSPKPALLARANAAG